MLESELPRVEHVAVPQELHAELSPVSDLDWFNEKCGSVVAESKCENEELWKVNMP